MNRTGGWGGIVSLFVVSCAMAADRTWNGGGGDANWSTAANWGGTAPVASDALLFGGTAGLANTNDLDEGTSFSGITFNGGAGVFLLLGNGLTLSGDIVNNDADTQTLNLPMSLDATRTVNAASGALVVNGVLSGTGGLIKTGAKTLTLSSANTFEGETSVQAGGRLLITHGEALGSPLAGTTIQTGTGIEIYNGITVAEPITLVNQNSGSMTFQTGSNTYSGLITITGGQARVQNQSMYAHITGGITSFNSTVIMDSGSAAGAPVLKISEKPILASGLKCFFHGARTAILGVAGNTFNNIEVSGGVLLLEVPDAWPATLKLEVGVSYARNSRIDLQGNDQSIGILTGVVTNDGIRVITSSTGPATLTVNQSSSTEFNSNFDGDLRLVKLGAGTLKVTGTNCQQTGQTVIGGGKLQILSEKTLGVEPVIFVADQLVVSNGATLLATGPCVLDDATRGITLGVGNGLFEAASGADMVISNAITGVGGLTKTGAGTLTLAGVNDYAGKTTVSAGILQVGQKSALYNGAALSSDNFTVGSGAVLSLNVGGAGEFASGDVSAIAAQGTSTTGFKPGSWLALSADNAPSAIYEVSDVIGNPSGGHGLNLQKLGVGTLALTGMNTYTGVTKISQGVLGISNIADGGLASSLGQSSKIRDNLIFAGGTLQYTGPTARTDRGFKYAVTTNVYAFEVTQANTVLTFGSVSNALFDGSNTTLKKTGPGTLVFGKSYPAGGHAAYAVKSIYLLEGKLFNDVAGNTIQQNLNCPASSGPALLLGDGVELNYDTPLERYNDRLVQYIGTQTCARLTSAQLTLCGPTTNAIGIVEYNTHTFDINEGADNVDLLIASKFGIYPSEANSHLIKAGGGTLKLASNQSAYRGATIIRNGRVIVSANVASWVAGPLGQSTNVLQLGDALTQSADVPSFVFEGTDASTFTFNRKIITYPTGGGATMGGISNNNVTFSGPIAVSNTLQITSVSAGGKAVTLSGAVSGSGGLAKIGSGVAVLTASNTYTGLTDVAEGTLRLGASERIADASGLRLSGGVFDPAGFNETMGPLDVDAAAELDFGAGACTLTFADSSAQTWDGALLLRGWTPGADHLFVGDSACLTEAQLAKITSPSGQAAAQLSSGEVVLLPLGTLILVQ